MSYIVSDILFEWTYPNNVNCIICFKVYEIATNIRIILSHGFTNYKVKNRYIVVC
jgi:hypothetical protein